MLEELGASLKETREARGLTLQDVEKATRIRARYLAALEEGNLEALPTPVQVRGFLRNYAQYIGLNPDQTLLRLDEALENSRRRSLFGFVRRIRVRPPKEEIAEAPPTPSTNGKPPPSAAYTAASFSRPTTYAQQPQISRRYRIRRFFTLDVFIAVALFLGIVAFFVWGGTRLAATVFAEPQFTATPQVLGPTITPTAIANITFTPTDPPPLVNFSDVQLTLQIEQRSFVRVLVDGELEFEGLLEQGEILDYGGARVIEVTTSNGAGVLPVLNQQQLGAMGSFGEVVTYLFYPNSWAIPTPSVTPIPSETPIPTGGPLFTDTPNPDIAG